MYEYDEECLKTFLKKQGQLFDEPVAETLEEAEAFLEDCMAVIADSLDLSLIHIFAAGLETGILTGDETYYCGGVLHVGDHDIHCSNRDGHGTQTLKQALENSCNVALMEIGEALGAEDVYKRQGLYEDRTGPAAV